MAAATRCGKSRRCGRGAQSGNFDVEAFNSTERCTPTACCGSTPRSWSPAPRRTDDRVLHCLRKKVRCSPARRSTPGDHPTAEHNPGHASRARATLPSSRRQLSRSPRFLGPPAAHHQESGTGLSPPSGAPCVQARCTGRSVHLTSAPRHSSSYRRGDCPIAGRVS